MAENDNGWDEYKIYITKSIESLNEKSDKQQELLLEIKADVSALKVKNAFWGGLSGLVTGAVGAVVAILKGR